MKPHLFLIASFFSLLLSVNASYAQHQDSLKQKQIKFYSKVLSAGQDTARQVATIMDTYKEGVKKVIADKTLSEETKRAQIDGLITDKNRKLAILLSPSQQEKIIPTTERKKNKPGK